MYSAQAIAPKYANVYASFDAIWLDPSGVVAGNSGLAEPRPDLIYMGSGGYMPPKITEERGIWLSGGQYCYADHDFDADEPFSIAVFTDSPMAAAGWLAATFRSDTNLGVRFGASAAGTLVATLQNAGGSITQTATGLQASREKRLYVLTYDGSGSAAGLRMHVDDLTLTSVSGGTTVSGSLSSGKPLSFGAQNDGVNPSQFLLGRLYAVAVYPHVLDAAMRGMLRAKMSRDVHASSPARYPGYDPIWTPIDLVQPGDSWLLTDLDGAGGVTLHTQPVITNGDFSSAVGWGLGTGWSVAGGVAASDGTTANIVQTGDNAIVGNRYLADLTLVSRVSGAMYSYPEFSGPFSVPAVYRSEGTAIATSLGVRSASCVGSVDNYATRNLSISALTCKGNLGNLAQATAASMQWSSDADAPTSVPVNGKRVVYGAALDFFGSASAAAAWKFLHYRLGGALNTPTFTLCLPIMIPSVTTTHPIFYTGVPGMFLIVGSTGVVQVQVRNGAGAALHAACQSAAGVVTNNTPAIITVISDATTLKLRVHGVERDSEAYTGAATDADPGNAMHYLGSNISGTYLSGMAGDWFAIDRALDPSETLKLEAYLRSYYAL